MLGCKNSKSGNYLIYKTNDHFPAMSYISPIYDYNANLQEHLKSAFIGKKFSFDFTDDYVTMKLLSSNTYDDLILNRQYGIDSIEYYYGERIIGLTTIQFRLMVNDTKYLIMAVDCSIPPDEPIAVPVQLGGTVAKLPSKDRVIFCLKEIE